MPHIWWTQSLTTVVGALLVALALYLLVVLAFRVVKRRTVAELAPFDLAAVIAIGAITGRTATGGDSVVTGLVAIVGLLLGHWLVTRLRRFRSARAVVDQPTAVLVLDGQVQHDALRRSGLTITDLQAVLRGHGVRSLDEVTAAVFETRNGISVLRASGDAPLWQHLD